MISPVVQPLVRRAILDLMFDIGGEHNHETLTELLNSLGHRVARTDVAFELGWLEQAGLVACDHVAPFVIARVLSDGRDVAQGRTKFVGVSPFKTGE